MGESSARRRRVSKAFKEQLFLNSKISKYGRCVIALWPDKPATALAQRLRKTERYANQLISGERGVSTDAMRVLWDEVD